MPTTKVGDPRAVSFKQRFCHGIHARQHEAPRAAKQLSKIQLEYLALTKHEAIRTTDEIEQEERQRERVAVIREFIESKTKKPETPGRN